MEHTMQGRCDKHQFESAGNLCRQCGGEFCAECLVYSFGPKRPPYCIACALAAAGVRTTAGNRPVKPKREIKKENKARVKAEKAAKKEGIPGVDIDWVVPRDPTEGMTEDELLLPSHATAEAPAEPPPPPPPPPPAPSGTGIDPGFAAATRAEPPQHLISTPDAFAPTPPPPPAEPPQHLLRSGEPTLPPPPPTPPPAPAPPPVASPASAPPAPPPAPPAQAPDLFAAPPQASPGDALPASSFGLDDAFDPVPTPARPPTKEDVEGDEHQPPVNWPSQE